MVHSAIYYYAITYAKFCMSINRQKTHARDAHSLGPGRPREWSKEAETAGLSGASLSLAALAGRIPWETRPPPMGASCRTPKKRASPKRLAPIPKIGNGELSNSSGNLVHFFVWFLPFPPRVAASMGCGRLILGEVAMFDAPLLPALFDQLLVYDVLVRTR